MTGASGLVGHALCKRLIQEGWNVVTVGRKSEKAFREKFSLPCEYFVWSDPVRTPPPREALEVEAIFHLMGEPIADQRWSAEKKKSLIESRVDTTQQLVKALRENSTPVRTFISASATGIYGDREDQTLEERSDLGQDFLAKLCLDWECESRQAPCRNVQMRIGVVLSEYGGAIGKLLPIFESGFAGRLGSGQQWMSWIHLDDLVRAFVHALNNPMISGPINATAPFPVKNAEFTNALAKATHVSAPFPVPAPALRLALGERAMILLQSQRLTPKVLVSSAFDFKYPTIYAALNAVLEWKESRHDRFFFSEQWVPSSRANVFQFFSDEMNLEALTPDFLQFKVLGKSTKVLTEGTEIRYRLRIHQVPVRWTSRITAWRAGEMFEDTQVRGPYGKWTHTHDFEDLGTGTLIRDRVVYRMPLSGMGGNLGHAFVRTDINKIFKFRNRTINRTFQES